MNQKIKALLKGFKPQFGNENHILALELIQKIEKREEAVKGKSERAKKNAKMQEHELSRLEFLLK